MRKMLVEHQLKIAITKISFKMAELSQAKDDILGHIPRSDEIESDFVKIAKLGFIRKVFGILSCQMGFTVLFCWSVMSSPSMQETMNEQFWIGIVAIIMAVVVLLVLVCSPATAKKVPSNYVLLSIFTACNSYCVGCICIMYEPASVVMVAAMALGVTIGLTIYAMTEKVEIQISMEVAVNTLCCLFCFGLCGFSFNEGWWEVLVGSVIVYIYGVYILVDVKRVVDQAGITPDDYIVGALMIYVDVVGLFVRLLSIIGKKKN
jgi:FtsH-binding integral membrane protein